MKVGIAGKGGTGKTTLVGTMARVYGRRGHRVVAIDADPHPTLATTIGIDMRRALQADELPTDLVDVALGTGPGIPPIGRILERHGIPGPDNVTLLIAHRLDHVEMHCNSATHATVRAILASLIAETESTVLVDMEAGVEHFSRAGGTLAHADALLVMVEPFHKSLVTGRQVALLAAELGIPHRYAVANKVRGDGDMPPVTELCEETGLELLGTVPWDVRLHDAEAQGRAPIDAAPASPAVAAARALAEELLRRVPQPSPAA